MKTLLFEPNDVLFFKDGRPMSGGLAGHGAAWPMPTVTNGALHAALWRAKSGLDSHRHKPGRNSMPTGDQRNRRFGSLLTGGPFPVEMEGDKVVDWFFPRPADAQANSSTEVTAEPFLVAASEPASTSSLPEFLKYSVASKRPPSKDRSEHWWNNAAYAAYLRVGAPANEPGGRFRSSDKIFQNEPGVGIAIDPATNAQDGESIYSAHHLRLQSDWRIGVVAECIDRTGGDLLSLLFTDGPYILVGGQRRLCTVRSLTSTGRLPLPEGHSDFAPGPDGICRVKWVLLAPAVWPRIRAGDGTNRPKSDKRGNPIQSNSGGWLPNWIAEHDSTVDDRPVRAGEVLLTNGPGIEKARRMGAQAGQRICAQLVAAIVPKPIPVTGYALANAEAETAGGPKPAHLAVPEGSVYYFETRDEAGRTAAENARLLAGALNWHGPVQASGRPDLSRIRNRRSTLFGEKGFGIGICGAWSPIPKP